MLAVALGAFGAHALEGQIGVRAVAFWRTASLYHLVHAAVVAALVFAPEGGRRWIPAGLLLAGIALFSGSLYLLAVTGHRPLARLTPVGGLFLLLGWATLPLSLSGRPR